MVLVDWQIRQLCEHQNLITPYNPKLVNTDSIDVRLGSNLIIYRKKDNFWLRFKKWFNCEIIHIADYAQKINLDNFDQANPYWLKPNEFVLAETLESLNLPANIPADFKLVSSRAREGLGHLLAGWVEGGFHGVLTLELKNYHTTKSIPLYPGLRVGQLVLHRTETPEKSYTQTDKGGRYAGHKTVMGSMGS